MRIKLFSFVLLFSFLSFSQNLKTICHLDKKLKEISGIEVLNDSCFLAHNDSGNDAILFVLNLEGKIIHEIKILNASNNDWEDITKDNLGNIYIADIGNNTNTRKDLVVYKIKSDSILLKNEISSEKIEFSYEDQVDFPPNEKDLHFDSEAMACFENELYIFTKCRTIPYDGKSTVYTLPTSAGKYKAKKQTTLQLKDRNMKFDGVTGATFDMGTCYILTYSGLEVFSYDASEFVKLKRIKLGHLSQKEALCVKENYLYIADEYYKAYMKNKFYKLKLK